MSFISNNCSVSLDASLKNGPERPALVPPPPPSAATQVTYWPIVLCFLMAMVYVVLGGLVFSSLMSTSFVDALFLSFMLFTTMGIPDSHKDGVWTKGSVVIGAVLYILMGLTLCSLCFNLIYEWLMASQLDNQLQRQRRIQMKQQRQDHHNIISTKMWSKDGVPTMLKARNNCKHKLYLTSKMYSQLTVSPSLKHFIVTNSLK